MEWSIQQIAKIAGTTSRTLRHYDEFGLLAPTRIAANGYRHYDEDALVRLQRILLLRQLGLGLAQIGEVLDREVPEVQALATHRDLLLAERDRLSRQIAAVTTTIHARENGDPLMAEAVFDGFDHAEHREEVERRWGRQAFERSDRWWRAMDAEERAVWQEQTRLLGEDWTRAAQAKVAPDGPEAQALAARHVAWLGSIPGTPTADGGDRAAYLLGLGEMYVADQRFAANYGGEDGARFVRDALAAFVAASSQ